MTFYSGFVPEAPALERRQRQRGTCLVTAASSRDGVEVRTEAGYVAPWIESMLPAALLLGLPASTPRLRPNKLCIDQLTSTASREASKLPARAVVSAQHW